MTPWDAALVAAGAYILWNGGSWIENELEPVACTVAAIDSITSGEFRDAKSCLIVSAAAWMGKGASVGLCMATFMDAMGWPRWTSSSKDDANEAVGTVCLLTNPVISGQEHTDAVVNMINNTNSAWLDKLVHVAAVHPSGTSLEASNPEADYFTWTFKETDHMKTILAPRNRIQEALDLYDYYSNGTCPAYWKNNRVKRGDLDTWMSYNSHSLDIDLLARHQGNGSIVVGEVGA